MAGTERPVSANDMCDSDYECCNTKTNLLNNDNNDNNNNKNDNNNNNNNKNKNKCKVSNNNNTKTLIGPLETHLKNGAKVDYNRMMSEDINKMLRNMPITDDIQCGFWIFKGHFFQRFANQTSYVILYGIVGCIFSMTYAYFNGTITTIEKRFKIPSRNTGIISVGNDISQMLASAVLSYYGGKGHRPRWIGFGLSTIVIFCLLMAAPHFLYGSGEDALALTAEFGGIADENATLEIIEEQRSKTLCRLRPNLNNGTECEREEGNLAPQIVLFSAQFISGIGGSLYYTLGVAYMDDNTKKSKTPTLLSLSYCLRMLGPAIGYTLASFCLRAYIAPRLQPIIKMSDPRWLGAWWLGWLIIAAMIIVFGIFLTMFPRELPRAKARRLVNENRRLKSNLILNDPILVHDKVKEEAEEEALLMKEAKASVGDMLNTFKRLTHNKTLMYNNLSSVFYLFGYTPYWIFTPKYIEIQYRQSAATSSMVTGTVALAFSAIGILISGFVISKYKPSARYLAGWNVITGFLTVAGMISYAFIGCPGNEQSVVVNLYNSSLDNSVTCNSNCYCDYVNYSPVCGEDQITYISPCHAGCKRQTITNKGLKTYYDCSCIPSLSNTSYINEFSNFLNKTELEATATIEGSTNGIKFPNGSGGYATSGSCPINCYQQFVTFLTVMCFLKFIGATSRASNFLVSVRCVPEKDKTASMGFGMMMMSMLAFIPSPIFFGWILDRLCIVWGKTCTHTGNCWLYDPESLRYILNFTASVFVFIGVIFDCSVWYYVKGLRIFDQEVNDIELETVQHKEQKEIDSEKNIET